MTQPLPPEREAEILARDEVATPGPWSAMVIDAETTSLRAGGQTARDSVRISWMRNVSAGDADFITHAREDVPTLLAELDRLRLELTAVEESATRTRLADMDAPQPTPGRDARYELYAALTYPQWNPATNSHSTGDEKAEHLIDAHRAQVLAEAKTETVAWLAKKARERMAMGHQYAKQADLIAVLADKANRGAIRVFLQAASTEATS